MSFLASHPLANTADWNKFAAYNSKPSLQTFPALPEFVTWARLFLGTVYGCKLGLGNETGGAGIIMGLNVVMFVPILYMKLYLGADMDSYSNLNFKAVPNALCLMLLLWTYFFTMLHADEEVQLATAKFVMQSVAAQDGTTMDAENGGAIMRDVHDVEIDSTETVADERSHHPEGDSEF